MPTFGAYDLIAPLASGGMAQLWLARSPGADGIVVVKRLLREHLGEPLLVSMFDDEAQLGGMIRHPNVVRQFEHGVAEGEPYIVLEYLQGENGHAIRRICRRKKALLPLEVTLELLRRLCEGLHAAHELCDKRGRPLGVVHRDVSPQNTIVTFDGLVKIVDFGIAKRRDRLADTRGGTLKGKVPYMAPEQFQSGIVDRRTDIYAVGVILYELTVGARPYGVPITSEFALMMAISRGEVRPPSAIQPDYSPRLEELVMRILSPQPDRRPPTAADLAVELDALRRIEDLPEGPELLRGWMAEHFAERIEGLRKATSEQELVERILDAEKRRSAQPGDEDDESGVATSPRGPEQRPGAGAAYSLSRRPLGGAMLAALQGRINETFDGAAVGSALSETRLTVLDLSGVLRLTSYGVREWMAMLERCRGTELWLARCSEAILTQLATIQGFAGHARVASLLLPFHCERCESDASKPFDLELDAEELTSGRLAPIPCAHCAGEATFDGDASWLLFGKRWIGEPLPAAVRGALAVLARDSAHAPPPLEKVVLGTETHIRIRDARGPRVRFRKLLDGVEGHLHVDVRDPTALDERTAGDLARALATLGPEVTSIEVRGAPAELFAALQGKPRVRVISRFYTAHCPACDGPRVVVAPVGQGASGPSLGAVDLPPCVRCNGRLVLPADAELPPASRRSPRVEATKPERDGPPSRANPASVGPAEPVRAPAPAPARRWLALGAAAVAGVGGWWLVTSMRQPDPAPAAASATDAAMAPASPREEVLVAAGNREIVAQGAGASEDEALAEARARAHALLLDAVKKALPPEVLEAITIAAKPTPGEDLARRWGLHFGAGAGLARASTAAIPSAEGRALSVRFRIDEASFQKAVSYFGTIESFAGLGVVPAFPDVADAGFLVVTAAAGKPGVRVGDVILAVGDRALSPSDHPASLSSSTSELRLARGATVPWRWP